MSPQKHQTKNVLYLPRLVSQNPKTVKTVKQRKSNVTHYYDVGTGNISHIRRNDGTNYNPYLNQIRASKKIQPYNIYIMQGAITSARPRSAPRSLQRGQEAHYNDATSSGQGRMLHIFMTPP